MNLPFYLLFILLGFLSCNGEETSPNIQTNGTLTLIDSSALTTNSVTYQPTDIQAYYPIFFIGKPSDTIILGKEPISTHLLNHKRLIGKPCNYYPDSNDMSIEVDTSFKLSNKVFYKHYSESNQTLLTDSILSYLSYPIFIRNLSDSVLFIGNFNCIENLVRQAQNRNNVWVDIEVPIDYQCSTGQGSIYLESGEILIAKLNRYNADFKTNCRLKYQKKGKIIYSNTFIDFVDSRLFLEPKIPSVY
ncbi:MAG: hypothetical protein ACOVOQ_05180 [Flavobacterium sp.]